MLTSFYMGLRYIWITIIYSNLLTELLFFFGIDIPCKDLVEIPNIHVLLPFLAFLFLFSHGFFFFFSLIMVDVHYPFPISPEQRTKVFRIDMSDIFQNIIRVISTSSSKE